jgi:hypothetical protein
LTVSGQVTQGFFRRNLVVVECSTPQHHDNPGTYTCSCEVYLANVDVLQTALDFVAEEVSHSAEHMFLGHTIDLFVDAARITAYSLILHTSLRQLVC